MQKNICEVKPVQKQRFLVLQFDQEFDTKKHLRGKPVKKQSFLFLQFDQEFETKKHL